MNALIPDPLDGFIGLPILQQKAGAIRALAKNVARDIVEIGRHLTEAKAACAHGEWLPWLESEFGWSEWTARRFMGVFDAFGKSGNVPDLDLPLTSLYALAAPSTPEPARAEVIARAESGETLSRAEVDARMWEISENLHRAELTVSQRAEQIAEFVRLVKEKRERETDKLAQVAPVSGGRGNEGGERLAARDLGITRDEVRRAEKIDAIAPEAKEAAREAGEGDAPECRLQRISRPLAGVTSYPPLACYRAVRMA